MRAIKKQRIWTFCVFALPALLIFGYFFFIPFCKTFYYCLTDWNGISKTYNFVWFQNFKRLLSDEIVWKALYNNLLFCIIGGILTFGIAIFNAVVITQGNLREKTFYRIVFYIPNILSTVIVTLLWMFIYNPSFGILNSALKAIGLEEWALLWLGNKSTVVPALIVVWVWMSVGFYMILYISAIEGIPQDLFEAAALDGASEWQKFKSITWPLILETTKTALVFFFINAFSGVYTLVDIMTEGGPAYSSEVLTHYMYQQAFRLSDFGYATTIGVFVFILLIIVTGAMLLMTKKKGVTEY